MLQRYVMYGAFFLVMGLIFILYAGFSTLTCFISSQVFGVIGIALIYVGIKGPRPPVSERSEGEDQNG